MSTFDQSSSSISQSPLSKAANCRKQYQKPQLEELGDLRTLTLGGSPGAGDTGNAGTSEPRGSLPQPGDFSQPDGFPQP